MEYGINQNNTEVHTICILPIGQNSTTYMNICNVQRKQFIPIIHATIKTITSVLPQNKTAITFTRHKRARINFCMFCKQETMDMASVISEIGIEDINNNFVTVEKQLNSMQSNLVSIQQDMKLLHTHISLLQFQNTVANKIGALMIVANKPVSYTHLTLPTILLV